MVLVDGTVDLHIVMPANRRSQKFRQVDPFGFPVIDCVINIQQVDSANHFVDRSEAEFCHDLASLFGDHEQVIYDVLRLAGKLLAKLGILSRNSDWAGVQVTLPHHDAAHGDQRRGRKAVFFRSQHGGDDHVSTSFQLTVSLQSNA